MPGATTENLGGSALTGLTTAPPTARNTARTQRTRTSRHFGRSTRKRSSCSTRSILATTGPRGLGPATLLCGVAPVHRQARARDERGVVGRQEQRRPRDLV